MSETRGVSEHQELSIYGEVRERLMPHAELTVALEGAQRAVEVIKDEIVRQRVKGIHLLVAPEGSIIKVVHHPDPFGDRKRNVFEYGVNGLSYVSLNDSVEIPETVEAHKLEVARGAVYSISKYIDRSHDVERITELAVEFDNMYDRSYLVPVTDSSLQT